MKTMEFNKIFGAATAALLIFLLAGFVSRSVYTISEPSTPGFALEIASAEPSGDAETAAPAGEEDFATLLASADPSGGPAIFRRCSACHKVEDGANGVGPHLYGVVGRAVGSVDGFRYSGALNAAAEVWGFDELNGFLTNPRGYAAGTSMGFAGLSNPRERATIIAWLNAQGPAPLPLPTPVAAVVEETPAVAEAPVEEVVEAEAAEEVAAAEEAPAAEVASAEPAAPAPAAPAPAAPAPAAAPDALRVALSKADAARGASLYATCALCHTLEEGRHGIAPSLYGVIGREVASIPRFPYSAALSAAGGVWSVERLDAYLAAPADMGGHAGLPGLADAQARADILTHVNAAVPGAAPLAEPAPAAVEEEVAAAPAEEAAPEVVAEAPAEAAPEPVAEAPAEAPAAEAVAEAPAEVAAPETAEPGAAEPEAVAEAPAETVEEQAAEAPAAAEEMVVAAAAPAEEPAEASAAGSDDPFVAAYLAATAADGQRQFRKCSACHRIEEGRNGVGPSLWNVVGRDIGSIAGFAYSNTLKGKGGAWSFENLNGFLANPKDWAPGTKMAFAGLKTIEERAAVIRYLNESGPNPLPIQ
jgi:cytochrome c2